MHNWTKTDIRLDKYFYEYSNYYESKEVDERKKEEWQKRKRKEVFQVL